jgi:hypothetical protein
MEVASPLPFSHVVAGGTGTKRSLTCSPQMFSPTSDIMENVADESNMSTYSTRVAKRRRFLHHDTSVESLSEHFSSHSPFFGSNVSSTLVRNALSSAGKHCVSIELALGTAGNRPNHMVSEL